MEERNISVDRENGGSLATFSLIAVIVVVALIGLFVWQPWNATTSASRTDATTTTTSAGTNPGTTSGSSTTTNGGTTNGSPR